jgi:hypothetical protein
VQLFVFGADRALLGVVESFEYLRWTRRYHKCGYFELQAVADEINFALLQIGHILWKNDDEEAGFIEHIELSMDEQERIFVRGHFATGILGRRIVWGSERLRGDLAICISQLIHNHLFYPADVERQITGFYIDDALLGISINTQATCRNLLHVVESLCETHDAGIKTVWNPMERLFTITPYIGCDSQAVFSREYENLTAQVHAQSLLDYSSIALVGGQRVTLSPSEPQAAPNGRARRGTRDGEDTDRTLVTVGGGVGMDRYELFVDAKDLQREEIGEDYEAALIQRGLSKLAEREAVDAFDAEINPHGNLTYKVDFDLGQRVRVESKKWGVTLTARITEIEETYDAEGIHLRTVFGRGLLTLAQKLARGME